MGIMQDEKVKTCSFFGHRHISGADGNLLGLLAARTERLIEQGFNRFLFGGYGDFDGLAHKAVNSLKEKGVYK
jgi:hypothetical protein